MTKFWFQTDRQTDGRIKHIMGLPNQKLSSEYTVYTYRIEDVKSGANLVFVARPLRGPLIPERTHKKVDQILVSDRTDRQTDRQTE